MRAGIVGYGHMGRIHAEVYREMGVDVRATTDDFDLDKEALKECDVVSICSPDGLHGEQVDWCIRHEKRFFVEKPFCLDSKHYEEIQYRWHMHPICEDHPSQFSCNLPLRRHPGFREIEDVGKIHYIRAAYHYGRPDKFRLGWRAKTPGYSIVMGGGIHMIDLALWIAGQDLAEVQSVGGNFNSPEFDGPDLAHATCKLSKGTIFSLTVNFTAHPSHRHELEVVGSKGSVSVTNEESVDKTLILKEFIQHLRGEGPNPIPPEEVFRSHGAALKIAEAI